MEHIGAEKAALRNINLLPSFHSAASKSHSPQVLIGNLGLVAVLSPQTELGSDSAYGAYPGGDTSPRSP